MVLITLMENAFQYGHYYPGGDPVIIAIGANWNQLIKLEITNPISARKRSRGTHTAQKRIESLFQLLDPESARMEVFASDWSYTVTIVFSNAI